MKLARRVRGVAAVALAVACGDGGSREKSVVIASGGDADVIVPLLWAQAQARVYTELMFDKLADIGMSQVSVGDVGYEPRLAKSWTWSADSLAITFQLDPNAHWHDGQKVRASDVRFAFDLFTDPVVASGPGTDMRQIADSVTVSDSLTATVWFKARSAEQFHSIAYNLVPMPEHLLRDVPRDSLRTSAYAKHPIGNGPFKFVAWERGVRFELAAFDAFARGKPKLDRVVFTIAANAPAAARAVFAGDADFIETVSLDDLAEAARHPEIAFQRIRGFEYGFLSFNLHAAGTPAPHPVLGDAGVRRALTMAVDRAALVKNVHDSIGVVAVGPFSRQQWSADTTLRVISHDVAGAERLLDSLGWKRTGADTRSKAGRPLAFAISVAATSRARVRYAELMQQSFAAIGAKVEIEQLDPPALAQRLGTHKFDAALFTWRTTPSPAGARQTWGTKSWRPGSPFNAGGYASLVFDAQVDSGLSARDVAQGKAHFRLAYQAAIDDAPAIWLYEPLIMAAAHRRVVTGPMRPDAWWQSIASWDVTAPAARAASGSGTQQ